MNMNHMKMIARVSVLSFLALVVFAGLAWSQAPKQADQKTTDQATTPAEYKLKDSQQYPPAPTGEEKQRLKRQIIMSEAEMSNARGSKMNPSDAKRIELSHLKYDLAKGKAEGMLTNGEIEKYENAIQAIEKELAAVREHETQRFSGAERVQNMESARKYEQQSNVADAPTPVTPAVVELKNATFDSPNPQVNALRQEMLQMKVEMESGRLSASEMQDYDAKLKLMETQVQSLENQ